ncbi:MAG: glycosyltransferase family 25 protein [Cytophagales bacterium]|nr:glycosyltransferase family 25 protein [Cytophagales bacterium]
MLPFPVYIVHLFRASHRRVHMDEQLRLAGITNYSYVEAVDGQKLGKADLSLHCSPDAKLSLGELGCYLSHRQIWEQMDRDGVEMALILEDDVILSADIVPVLSQASRFPPNWELIHVADISYQLSHAHVLNHWGRRSLALSYQIGISMSSRVTGMGYLVHQRGLKRSLPRLGKDVDIPVDNVLFDYAKGGYFFHSMKPSLVFLKKDIESDIRVNRTEIEWKKGPSNLSFLERIFVFLRNNIWVFLSFFPPPRRIYVYYPWGKMRFRYYIFRLVCDYFFRRR